MMLLYIPVAIAIVCFILYALDRRAKEEPIDWITAAKLSLFGGLISGGLVYSLSGEITLPEVLEVPTVQEMFVGTPAF